MSISSKYQDKNKNINIEKFDPSVDYLMIYLGPAQPFTAQPRSIDIKTDTTVVATLKVKIFLFLCSAVFVFHRYSLIY